MNTVRVASEFESNGMRIFPSSKSAKIKTRNFVIYETNYSQFFIKVYNHKNQDLNLLMKKSNLECSRKLLSKNLFPVKILKETQTEDKKLLCLLTESYVLSLREMMDLACASHEFDILKLFVQIGKYLEACSELDIQMVQLDENSVVLDRDGNFQLANLDSNVSTETKDKNHPFLKEMISKAFDHKYPPAPEITKSKQISGNSMIWDLGVLALRIFTGSWPKVDYCKKIVDLSLAKSMIKTPSQKVIFNLISRCLTFSAGKRIGIGEVISQATSALTEVSGFLSSFNSRILKDVWGEFNQEIKSHLEQIGDLVSTHTFRRDSTLIDFIYEKVIYRDVEMTVKKTLRILLEPSQLILDDMLRDLIGQSWNVPMTIVKVYNFMKAKIGEIVRSEIKTMKLLLVLHSFIFKGSQNTLIVFLKEDHQQNSVNCILDSIIREYSNRKQSLIFKYTYFLYIKFNFQLKYIKVLENNFTVSNTVLVHNFEQLLAPEVFADLFGFLKFTFTLYLSLRKFSFDYFYRSFIVAVFKELKNLLALLANMMTYILFGLTVVKKTKALSFVDIQKVDKQLKHFLETLDFMARSMNIYIEQLKKLEYESFRFFQISDNLSATFETLRKKMHQKIWADPSTMNSKYFLRNYLNTLLKMSESLGVFEDSPEKPPSDSQATFTRIISSFIQKSGLFLKLKLNVGSLVPEARRWSGKHVKLGTVQIKSKSLKSSFTTGKALNIKKANVGEMVLSALKPSFNTCIISYDQLKFEELILSDQTYTLHKGDYKNIKVAIKKLRLPNSPKQMEDLQKQLNLFISLPHHPNLQGLIGFCIKANNIFLVTEFYEGGTLFDILLNQNNGWKLSFKQKIKILLDVARGMQFLHQLQPRIIHESLKSVNIWIDTKIKPHSLDFQAKIVDFVLDKSYEDPFNYHNRKMGTFHWMAPEIFSDKPYTTKSDMYAFAILAWEVFSGKIPYHNLESPTKIIKFVYYDNGRPPIQDCTLNEIVHKDIVQLLETNWHKTPDNRQEFEQVYQVLDRVLHTV